MPVASSPAFLASRWNFWIRQRGQAVTCYAPGSPPGLLGTTTALFEFGQAAVDAAMAAGVDPNQTAVVYVLSTTDPAFLRHRGYLKDAQGVWWLIESRPAEQPLGATTVGVEFLVRRQVDAPVGG